jgi:DNA-directed RNA polymerase sigma subunit (sigma70/sigma32)
MANTTKKPTIVENFKDIIKVLEENGLLTEDRKAFLEKRIEVTEKKNASKGGEKKLSKEQIANEEIKSNILNEMEAGKSYTISDMLKSLNCCEMLSQNKVNALVKQLKDEGKVIRTEAKGKAYFTLA